MAFLRIFEAIAALATEAAHAALVPAVAPTVCPVPGFPCTTGISIEAYLGRIAGTIGGSALGIVTAMLIFYSLKLATSGQDESHATEVRSAYLHVIYGAVLIAGASFIAATVPARSGVAQPASMIANVIIPMRNFFFTMVAAALTINIAYHGAKLIVVQEDSAAGAARQGIIKGVLGLAAVFLAGTAVNTFGFNEITGLFLLSGVSTAPISAELSGIGRFLIVLLGALAVVCVVAAGFFLVISADEQLKDRSKKIIITVAVTLIVVMASAIILSVFF